MKRIFFLILLAVMSTGIYAQTDDKGYKEGAWVLNGVTGLNLSQTAMTNWGPQETSSIANQLNKRSKDG